MGNKKGSIILRILLSPLVFIWGLIVTVGISLFPGILLIFTSFFGLLFAPIAWLLNKSGANVKSIEPLFDQTGNDTVGHSLGLTYFIWAPFSFVYNYIRYGIIIGLEDDSDEYF